MLNYTTTNLKLKNQKSKIRLQITEYRLENIEQNYKFQITNHKQITIYKSQEPNYKPIKEYGFRI